MKMRTISLAWFMTKKESRFEHFKILLRYKFLAKKRKVVTLFLWKYVSRKVSFFESCHFSAFHSFTRCLKAELFFPIFKESKEAKFEEKIARFFGLFYCVTNDKCILLEVISCSYYKLQGVSMGDNGGDGRSSKQSKKKNSFFPIRRLSNIPN